MSSSNAPEAANAVVDIAEKVLDPDPMPITSIINASQSAGEKIADIAKGFGIEPSKLWEQLSTDVRAEGAIGLLIVLVVTCIWWSSWRMIRRMGNANQGWSEERRYTFIVTGWLMSLVGLVSGLWKSISYAVMLAAPYKRVVWDLMSIDQ